MPPTTTSGRARRLHGLELSRGAALFQARRGQPALRRRLSRLGGPLGVSMPVTPLPICEAYIRAGQELGIPYNPDFNGAQQEGVGYYQLTQRNAPPLLGAVAYLDADQGPAEPDGPHRRAGRPAIVVENGRAVGVEIVDGEGRARRSAREREVLVTSGAIGSPKLLLQSGIGPADHLTAVGVPVDPRPAGRRLEPAGPSRPLRHLPNAPATTPMTATPSCTARSGPACSTSCSAAGPVASSLFETGGFWYADPDAPLARHPVPSRPRLRHRGRRREAEECRRDAELRLSCSRARAARCGWPAPIPPPRR